MFEQFCIICEKKNFCKIATCIREIIYKKKITNNKGPRTLPCGIPLITECQAENSLLNFTLWLRGATTAEKLRGTKVWVLTPGRLRPAPGQRPGWGWVREGVAPSCCGGPGVSTPEIFFWKQMLNPAFWWLLRSLVGSRGRVYSSKQQACQGLN